MVIKTDDPFVCHGCDPRSATLQDMEGTNMVAFFTFVMENVPSLDGFRQQIVDQGHHDDQSHRFRNNYFRDPAQCQKEEDDSP